MNKKEQNKLLNTVLKRITPTKNSFYEETLSKK
jgi:hypothetical protein